MDLVDVYEDMLDYVDSAKDSISNLIDNFQRLEDAMQDALVVNGEVVDLAKIQRCKNDAQNEIYRIQGKIVPAIEADIEELEDDEDDDD